MTTTIPQTPPDLPPTGPRLLRRSRTDRLGAGVAGGLGEYFGVDPVLFRVLFGTAAFFGGAGVLAYLLAWAAIPEAGTERASIDGWVAEMRRRRIPFWVVAVIVGVIFWAVAFSWWAPGPFFPVVAVVVLLIVAVSRTGRRPAPPTAPASPAGPAPVSLSKEDPGTAPQSSTWRQDTRAWLDETRSAARERRARAMPVRVAVLVAVVLSVTGLAIADAVSGIRLPVYFWVVGAIVLAGLLVGLALRRTPWSVALLLLPVIAGIVAFGNTGASLHDGIGQRSYTPTSAAGLPTDYRLAFGQTVLDLRRLGPLDAPRTVDITSAAGQVRVLLPDRLNATVHANVRIGEIEVNGTSVVESRGGPFHRRGGFDIRYDVVPPARATGAPLTVNVHLADGQIDVRQ